MGIERKRVSEKPKQKIGLAEALFHTLASRGADGKWFKFVLEDGRQVGIAAYCLPWTDLPLPYSLNLVDEETEETRDWFYDNLKKRGLDSCSVFFFFLEEKTEKEGPDSRYSDQKTVEVLRLLERKYGWGYSVEVVPDDLARALAQTLRLEGWEV